MEFGWKPYSRINIPNDLWNIQPLFIIYRECPLSYQWIPEWIYINQINVLCSIHTHTHTILMKFIFNFFPKTTLKSSKCSLNNCLIKKKGKVLLINNNAFMFLLAVVLESVKKSVKKWMTTPGSNLCKTTLPHWHNVPLNLPFCVIL